MTDAITRKHQIISTGFLNKIKFPSGYEGDRKKKIDSGDLVELLVDNCSPRLTYNLLTLEPEFDGQTIQIDFVESFSTYLNMYGYNIRKDSAFDGLLIAARQNTYHPVNAYLERIAQRTVRQNPTPLFERNALWCLGQTVYDMTQAQEEKRD